MVQDVKARATESDDLSDTQDPVWKEQTESWKL